jgi:hypothetical protein
MLIALSVLSESSSFSFAEAAGTFSFRVQGPLPVRTYTQSPSLKDSLVGFALPPKAEVVTVRIAFAGPYSTTIFDDQSVCGLPTAFDEVVTVIRYFSPFHLIG